MSTSPLNYASRTRRSSVHRTRIVRIWIILSSIAIAGYFVGQYMTASLQDLSSRHVGLATNYASQGPFIGVTFYFHIVFAGLALALGPFQFIKWIRVKHKTVHRIIGRIYVVSVVIGSVAALIMSTVSTVAISGFFGFGTLAILWGLFAINGYRAIRRGDVASHRAWMMRSFALTYAAVTLRLWLGILIAVQIPFLSAHFDFNTVYSNAYAPLAYLCWIPNIVVAELLIRRRGLPALRMTRRPEIVTLESQNAV